MKREQFDVTGMTCSACSARVERGISKLEGVNAVSVNLLKNSMAVSYDEAALAQSDIIAKVEAIGYGAALHGAPAAAAAAQPAEDKELESMKRRLVISAVFTVPLFYLCMGGMFGWPLPSVFLGMEHGLVNAFTQFLLVLPVIYINRRYFKVGLLNLVRRSPNMDSLIAVGSGAALVYGIYAIYKLAFAFGIGDAATIHKFSHDLYFESAGMILTLITLGKYFEARAKRRTSDAITKLMNLTPKTATLLQGSIELTVPVEDVVVDDLLVVKAGDTVPVDGVLTEGSGALNESAITGESLPVEKAVGDRVTGGTANQNGYFIMKATAVGEDTALAQIIRLVDDATSSKAPIAKLADKISGVFVPVVIGIALVAAVVWLVAGQSFEFALTVGISVLVISCPCALGLATPTAIMVGTGRGAAAGILIKSAESLETAHAIDTVVLDKTGTITEGKPVVTDVIGADVSPLLAVAASLERQSGHPLAEPILRYAEAQGVPLTEAANYELLPGQGIAGVIDGKRALGGNLRLMEAEGIDCSALAVQGEALAAEGKTPLYFAQEGKALGLIAVADVVKPTSKQAIRRLQEMGIHVVMLTGDNARTAAAIGRQVGLENVISEVLPADKERQVRALQEQGHRVAMVGDGINDAPALARADVGIAIGAGTDIALESADIVLMKSDLNDVPAAIQLSKAVMRNIRQNLFWALIYNTIGIPVAAGVLFPAFGLLLNPMLAAAAMSFSSLSVVSNALRLRFFTPKIKSLEEKKG